MKINSLLSCSLVLTATATGLHTEIVQAAKPVKPINFVLIYLDDMGYGDLGITGASGYQTPNLDRMAREGIFFSRYYSPQAVCSASRAGLLTGCYPNRVGISGALFPKAKTGLSPEEETIAEVLKKKNYKTLAVGKWHLGDHPNFMPTSQGFDEYLGVPYSNDMWPFNNDNTRATPETNKTRAGLPELPLYHNLEVIREFKSIKDQADITTLYTEKAVRFIRDNQKQPFFLYLAHNLPHVPLSVSEKFKGKSRQGLYGDVMMELDWSVGQVLKTIDELKLDKQTLIIFTSDNGPWLNFGNHAGTTGGLREGKGCTFEGGQRVPCLMRWKGVIQEGITCSRLVCGLDILPTIAEVAGTPLPERKIDGVNILPLMKGDRDANPRKAFYYYYRKNNLEAVTNGDWKLVFPHPGRTYEGFMPGNDANGGKVNENFPFPGGLYDLRRDPGERYNVAELYPEMLKELEKIGTEAREDLGDDLTGNPGKNRRPAGAVPE
jgi:arylsulfatase A-like enzyme